ncbi:SIR2 family NAD-dependent protein deacylase [Desulfobacca acetoxidans]
MDRYANNKNYALLVQALRKGLIVPVVGAGVTKAVCETVNWTECLEQLIDEILSRAGSKSNPSISELFQAAKHKITLDAGDKDPLFTADLCRTYLQEDFETSVGSIIKTHQVCNVKAADGLKAFLELPCYRIITTNYDNLLADLDRQLHPDKRIEFFTHKKSEEFVEFLRSGDTFQHRKIFHLHGNLEEPGSIIFSESDYQKLYTNEKVLDLLQAIFFSKSALFIGFSLNDYDVMQTFRQLTGKFPSPDIRHFAIFPRPLKTQAECWLETLRFNYKYSVGLLYYDLEPIPGTDTFCHDNLWKLIGALRKDVKVSVKEPVGRIAILLDQGFSYGPAVVKLIDYLNKVQSEIRYELLTASEVEVNLPDRFIGVDKPKDPAFKPVDRYSQDHPDLFDGYFIFTDKNESKNYFFYNRQYLGWASTWFWKKFVGSRPTMDEFLLHVLVLLTLYFFDAKLNKYKKTGIERAFLKPHPTDVGCLFDFTEKLRNRLAIINYPRICEEHQAKLVEAFRGKKLRNKELSLGVDWIRRVIPLAE